MQDQDASKLQVAHYQFDTIEDLVKFAEEAYKCVSELEKKCKDLQKAKDDLEFSLESDAALDIAEMELTRLRNKTIAGELSLEDAKKYDILVKNKNLTLNSRQGKARKINKSETQKLLEIAKNGK